MLPTLGRGDPRWHFHRLWVNRVLRATTRPMTSTSFRSFQLRMEARERGRGTRVNDSSRGSNSYQPQKSASRVLRIIQTWIIQGDRFTDPSVLMFSVADNHYVASSDVAVSLKKSANIHLPVWDSCAIARAVVFAGDRRPVEYRAHAQTIRCFPVGCRAIQRFHFLW
jgi:hypothetical protein